ncbi:acetoacetate decarboxylase family protein [Chryseobacterium sp. Alg-005]
MNIFKILTTAGLVGIYSQVIAGTFGSDAAYQKYFDSNTIIVNQKNQIIMDTIKPEQTIIDLAGHQVPVLKGGLYDRFRSNPPLSVIEKERPEIDLSWFKTIQKEKKDVGFTTYSPNFYYSNSSITAIYTADMKTLKKLIPEEVRDIVKPISITPGRGLIAITAYAYHYCDNDSYNELSISIVTTKPDAGNWGVFSLLREVKNKSLWGYVLKLPVDTELARVRGVVGYNLPKWLIPIDYSDKGDSMIFTFYDGSGKPDFSMEGKKLDIETIEPEIVRSNFINLDKSRKLTHGYTDVRALKKASSKNKEDIELKLTDGPLSAFIKSLDLGKLMRYDYQPEFQAALYTPEPTDNTKK